jgi:hypothetical protein
MTWGVATAWRAFYPAGSLAKVAFGPLWASAFADISSVLGRQKRGFGDGPVGDAPLPADCFAIAPDALRSLV